MNKNSPPKVAPILTVYNADNYLQEDCTQNWNLNTAKIEPHENCILKNSKNKNHLLKVKKQLSCPSIQESNKEGFKKVFTKIDKRKYKVRNKESAKPKIKMIFSRIKENEYKIKEVRKLVSDEHQNTNTQDTHKWWENENF